MVVELVQRIRGVEGGGHGTVPRVGFPRFVVCVGMHFLAKCIITVDVDVAGVQWSAGLDTAIMSV